MDIDKNSSINKNPLFKITSKYIIMQILDNLQQDVLLRIINYNKRLQKIMSIKKSDYEKEFSKIVIHINPKENSEGVFINLKNYKSYHIYFNNKPGEIKQNYLKGNEKISSIKIILDYKIKKISQLFKDCICIKSLHFKRFQRNDVDNISELFSGCSSLENIYFYNFNTEYIKDMSGMFDGCTSLKDLDFLILILLMYSICQICFSNVYR